MGEEILVIFVVIELAPDIFLSGAILIINVFKCSKDVSLEHFLMKI